MKENKSKEMKQLEEWTITEFNEVIFDSNIEKRPVAREFAQNVIVARE